MEKKQLQRYLSTIKIELKCREDNVHVTDETIQR